MNKLRKNTDCNKFSTPEKSRLNASQTACQKRSSYGEMKLRSIIQQLRSMSRKEKRPARKKIAKELGNWYFKHVLQMKSLELMKSFVKRMQENNDTVDCEELNKFFQDKEALYMQDNADIGKYCKNITVEAGNYDVRKHQGNLFDQKHIENEDTYYQAVRRLADEALDAYDKGLYGTGRATQTKILKLQNVRRKMNSCSKKGSENSKIGLRRNKSDETENKNLEEEGQKDQTTKTKKICCCCCRQRKKMGNIR